MGALFRFGLYYEDARTCIFQHSPSQWRLALPSNHAVLCLLAVAWSEPPKNSSGECPVLVIGGARVWAQPGLSSWVTSARRFALAAQGP